MHIFVLINHISLFFVFTTGMSLELRVGDFVISYLILHRVSHYILPGISLRNAFLLIKLNNLSNISIITV